MSNTLAIAAVTATLRHRLDGALNAAAARNEGVTGAQTFSGPPGTSHAAATAGALVYLYRTVEHPNWRNEDLAMRDAGGNLLRPPVAPLQLRYLITAFGDESAMEPSRVMGVIATYLHANPTLTPAMITAAELSGQYPFMTHADLDEQVEPVRFTPVPLADEDLNRIWSMLPTNDFALSAVYDASTVLLEEPATTTSALPVLRRGVMARPVEQPVITSIVPTGGTPGTAIRAGTSVDLRGRSLRSDTFRVEIDGVAVPAVALTVATSELIRFAVPAATPSGPRMVRVVHDLGTLPPSLTVFDIASDPAVMLVRPLILSITKAGGNVRVNVASPIGASQSLEVALNRQGGSQSVVLPGTLGPATRVSAPLAGLTPGTYLVRLRVDGVETVADPPTFAFPTVIVP